MKKALSNKRVAEAARKEALEEVVTICGEMRKFRWEPKKGIKKPFEVPGDEAIKVMNRDISIYNLAVSHLEIVLKELQGKGER